MWNQQAVDQWYQQNLSAGAKKADLDSIVKRQQADYLVSQGVPASEIETSDIGLRSQTQQITKEGGYKKVKPKLRTTAAADMSLARGVIDASDQAISGHQEKFTGLLDSLLGAGRTKLGGEEARPEVAFRQNIGDVRTAVRSYISGKQVTPSEAKEFKALIPKVSDSDIEIKEKLAGLKRKMMAEGQYILDSEGLELDIKDYLPESKTAPPAQAAQVSSPAQGQQQGQLPPVLDKVLSGIPLAAGIGGRQLGRSIPVVGQIPGVSGAIGGAAAASGGRLEQVLRGEAPPEAYQAGLAGRGMTGKELGMVGTGAALDVVYAGIGKIIGTLRGGGPKKVLADKRLRLAAGKEASLDPVSQAGQDYINQDPLAKSYGDKVLPQLKGVTSVEDLLKKLKIWGKAYSSAGQVGKSAKAGFYDSLYRAGSEQIKQVAPEVAKYTNLLRLTYQLPKQAQKATWLVLKTTALGKLLGL